MFSIIPRGLFRLISYIAAAIFLWNATIFIYTNFGLFWTLVGYFTFFICFLFFPIWAYFFFGFFDMSITIAWFITVVEAIYTLVYEGRLEKKSQKVSDNHYQGKDNFLGPISRTIPEYKDDYDTSKIENIISLCIFPFAKNISDVHEEGRVEILHNETSDMFILLAFDKKKYSVVGTQMSGKLAEYLQPNNQPDGGMRMWQYQKAIEEWGAEMSSEEFRQSNYDFSLLESKKFVTGDTFVVATSDNNEKHNWYLAGK